jgi:hypothetical protein
VKRWLDAYAQWVILVVGWVAFLVYAHPGLMTKDSFDQLDEARAGLYSDGHPPLMQLIWSICDRVIAGPFGMLLLQTGLFLGGMYLVFRRALKPRASAIAAVALLLFPPVGAVMAVVWKDCLMAGLLAMACGLALYASARPEGERRKALYAKIAAVAFACVAAGIRYNAAAATLPLIVFVFPPVSGWKARAKRYGIAGALWLATTGAALGADSLLTDKPTYAWYSSLAVGDIVGTLHYMKQEVPDERLLRWFRGTPLTVGKNIHAFAREHYRPDVFIPLVSPGPGQMFDFPQDQPTPEAAREPMANAYKAIVKGHLIAFARHRLLVFLSVLGFVGDSWDNQLIVTHDYQQPDLLAHAGVSNDYSSLQHGIDELYKAVSRTPLFRPYLYFVLALVLVWLARKQSDVVALLASGLLLEGSLFLIGPSNDYRYSHWLVVSSLLGLVFVIARRRNPAPSDA